MSEFTNMLSTLLAAGSILLMLGAVYVAYMSYQARGDAEKEQRLARYLAYVLPALAVLTVSASVLTLIYSEFLGFIPCGLCWLERSMLYPSAIILSVAAWKRDFGVLRYVIILTTIGAIIALYHHYLQVGGVSVLPCPASGNGDCGKRLIYEFGFVTFPLMAFAVFICTISVSLATRRLRSFIH